MKSTLKLFANSSRLSYLSDSPSVILTNWRAWYQRNFLGTLIGYVIHKQCKYEQLVQRHINSLRQLKICSNSRFYTTSNNKTVFIR